MPNSGTATIHVLDPTASPRDSHGTTALRLETLRGRSIGFLWNSKPNGDVLFAELEDSLRRDHHIGASLHISKPNSSTPAAKELIARLATSVSAVIVGIGD